MSPAGRRIAGALRHEQEKDHHRGGAGGREFRPCHGRVVSVFGWSPKKGAEPAYQHEKPFIPPAKDLSLSLQGIAKFSLKYGLFTPQVLKENAEEVSPEETQAILKTINFPIRQITRIPEAIRSGISATIDKKPPLKLLQDVAEGFISPERVPTLTSKIPFQDWEQGDWKYPYY